MSKVPGHPKDRDEDFKSEPVKEEQKDKARGVFFRNYDYTEEGPNATSPGGGLFHGDMSKYKSIKDFLETRRRENKKAKAGILSRMDGFLELLNVKQAGSVINFPTNYQHSISDKLKNALEAWVSYIYERLDEFKNYHEDVFNAYDDWKKTFSNINDNMLDAINYINELFEFEEDDINAIKMAGSVLQFPNQSIIDPVKILKGYFRKWVESKIEHENAYAQEMREYLDNPQEFDDLDMSESDIKSELEKSDSRLGELKNVHAEMLRLIDYVDNFIDNYER